MKSLLLIFILFPIFLFASEDQSVQFSTSFTGSIDKAEIQGELSNVNGQLIGWYNYLDGSTKLRIEGTFSNHKDINLVEYNYKAQQTGLFKGKIKGLIISGEWRNPDGSKRLPFRITIKEDIFKEIESPEQAVHSITQSEKPIEKRKMFQDSKVKGFSKLALWVTIGLIMVLGFTIVFLLRNKKKALEQQEAMFQHTKKEHYTYEHIAPSNSASKTSARIGYEFEKIVVDLFDEKYFRIKHWSSDKVSNNHTSAEANQYPDLLIEYKHKDVKRAFALECKYRSALTSNGFTMNEKQLENYRQFESENNIKVFVSIGIAGSPSEPKDIYIVPLGEFKTPNLPLEKLKIWYRDYKKSQFFYDSINETLKLWKKELNKSSQ